MGEIFKSCFVTNIDRFLFLLHKLVMRELQSFPGKPSLWRVVERLFEIPFERCQASSGEVPEFLHREIEHNDPLHIINQIDLTRLFAISDHSIEFFVHCSEKSYLYSDRQLSHVRRNILHKEIRDQRSKTTFHQRMIAE